MIRSDRYRPIYHELQDIEALLTNLAVLEQALSETEQRNFAMYRNQILARFADYFHYLKLKAQDTVNPPEWSKTHKRKLTEKQHEQLGRGRRHGQGKDNL